MAVMDRLKKLLKQRDTKDLEGRAPAGGQAAPPEAEPDFADEHTRPTYADEPNTEQADESVPRDRGGAGGMDVG
ncbi:MAG TPA: hypothetical protein VH969_16715 [Actinophytocola sp.]|jgi:hypothetical protein|uniref:hypothetical protein n=1 Tax=Actinophytocola sp. TaxID=1872138 RepID=UPI002F91C4AF